MSLFVLVNRSIMTQILGHNNQCVIFWFIGTMFWANAIKISAADFKKIFLILVKYQF